MEANIALPLDLGTDVNAIDISRPALRPGPYPMRIDSLELVESKSTPGGRNLRVDFSNTQDVLTSKDVSVPVGMFKISRFYPVQAAPGTKDPTSFARNLVELQDAALKTTQGNRPPFVPSDLLHKEVIVTLKVAGDDSQFPGSNEVSRVSALRQA